MKSVEVQKCDQSLVLREVAEEQNFKVEYLDISPQHEENKYRSLVSLGLESRVIFMGSGVGVVQAQNSAAYNALAYLRLAPRN